MPASTISSAPCTSILHSAGRAIGPPKRRSNRRSGTRSTHASWPHFLEQRRFLEIGTDLERRLTVVIAQSDGVKLATQAARQASHVGKRFPRRIDQVIEGVRKGAIERESAVGNPDIEDGGRRKSVMLQHAHRARPGRQARQLRKRRRQRPQPVLEMRRKPLAGTHRLARVAVRHRHSSIGLWSKAEW
jgi:hypothetical protein